MYSEEDKAAPCPAPVLSRWPPHSPSLALSLKNVLQLSKSKAQQGNPGTEDARAHRLGETQPPVVRNQERLLCLFGWAEVEEASGADPSLMYQLHTWTAISFHDDFQLHNLLQVEVGIAPEPLWVSPLGTMPLLCKPAEEEKVVNHSLEH